MLGSFSKMKKFMNDNCNSKLAPALLWQNLNTRRWLVNARACAGHLTLFLWNYDFTLSILTKIVLNHKESTCLVFNTTPRTYIIIFLICNVPSLQSSLFLLHNELNYFLEEYFHSISSFFIQNIVFDCFVICISWK